MRRLPGFARNQLIRWLSKDCDAIVIFDLDSDINRALLLVENLSSRNSAVTVMSIPAAPTPTFLVNCMRAGARELIREPSRRAAGKP